jgi:hypothetical protein
MRNIILLMLLIAVITGCARDPVVPPANSGEQPVLNANTDVWEGPYRLWGEWDLLINDIHERVDVVPRRQGRFHLNALKFLESYCTNCLKITGLKNNGDGTIDLTVQLTHPFPGMPQYTGFDVKGIIMFQGSHEFPDNLKKLPLYPQNWRASWRLLGDPELLNPDGYTYRWSPWYDSGSDMPIFKYWEGKFSSGTPTANINGYLDFYSDPNRHMFECDKSVSRTYHISLPTGPVTVGYAVEACWEPPTVTPVTNPAEDFPFSANQPEPYHFNIVFNDNEPITDPSCCNKVGDLPYTVHEGRVEIDFWYHLPEFYELYTYWFGSWTDDYEDCKPGCPMAYDFSCDGPPDWLCFGDSFTNVPDGTYQWIGFVYSDMLAGPGEKVKYPGFDLFEVIIDFD